MRLRERVHVEVDQAPCLQEGVHSNHRACVSAQVTAAGGGRQVSLWILPIQVDDEIAHDGVFVGCLRLVFSTEELRQGFLLDLMDPVCVKPLGTAGDAPVVGYLHHR